MTSLETLIENLNMHVGRIFKIYSQTNTTLYSDLLGKLSVMEKNSCQNLHEEFIMYYMKYNVSVKNKEREDKERIENENKKEFFNSFKETETEKEKNLFSEKIKKDEEEQERKKRIGEKFEKLKLVGIDEDQAETMTSKIFTRVFFALLPVWKLKEEKNSANENVCKNLEKISEDIFNEIDTLDK